jgi:hypothetical protein
MDGKLALSPYLFCPFLIPNSGYLDSGDPILIAEALQWGQQNPGLLEFNQLQLPKLDTRDDVGKC